MFGKQNADLKVAMPDFFRKADGTGNPAVALGVAATVDLTIRDRVAHIYRSAAYATDGITPAPADYNIQLPPVAECRGLTFAFVVVENLLLAGTNYYATIIDQDDSVQWADIVLKALGESVVLYSDGLKWYVVTEQRIGILETITSSGAVTAGKGVTDLEHVTQIAATIANSNAQLAVPGLYVARCTLEPTTTHTLTLTAGHFDVGGVNHIATFSDIDDMIAVLFDAEGVGQVIANVGVVLSAA